MQTDINTRQGLLSYLDAAASLLFQQNVLRLEVAVDDAVLVEQVQTLQN